jgi:hypothetical protein
MQFTSTSWHKLEFTFFLTNLKKKKGCTCVFNVLYSQNIYSTLQITDSGTGSCDILVPIVTRLQAAWQGNLGRKFFYFSKALWPIHPHIQMVILAFSLGVKQQGHEGDLIPPTGATIKILWSYGTTLPCGAKVRMVTILPVSLLEEEWILPEFVVAIVLRPACASL